VVAFGSQKGIVRAPVVMSNLQMLEFLVDVRSLIRKNGSCDNHGLEYLPSFCEIAI
jgi:hypothetical protein